MAELKKRGGSPTPENNNNKKFPNPVDMTPEEMREATRAVFEDMTPEQLKRIELLKNVLDSLVKLHRMCEENPNDDKLINRYNDMLIEIVTTMRPGDIASIIGAGISALSIVGKIMDEKNEGL